MKTFAVWRDAATYAQNAWEWSVTALQEDARTRRHAAINQLLCIFSRRTEITVGLVGLLRTVFRGQGLSEKLKTVGSLFRWNVGRGHIVESFTVEKSSFLFCHVCCPSVTRCASHRTLKFSLAAQHMAIVARIRTDWLR